MRRNRMRFAVARQKNDILSFISTLHVPDRTVIILLLSFFDMF